MAVNNIVENVVELQHQTKLNELKLIHLARMLLIELRFDAPHIYNGEHANNLKALCGDFSRIGE